MSGFNSFVSSLKAGQDAQQQRQNAFNASIISGEQEAIQAPVARLDTGGGATQNLAQVFANLDPARRQEVKADLSRKGQIIAALAPRPAEEQVIGIKTFGKEWGIDAATRERAAANPAKALAEVSSSIQQAEAMLEQLGHDSRPRHFEDKAPIYGNPRGIGREERPVTLMAQVAERQSVAADPNERQISIPQIPDNPAESLGSLSQGEMRPLSSDVSTRDGQLGNIQDSREDLAKKPGALFDIGNIAKGAEEAYDGGYGEGYTYAQPQGRFGANTNKCNLFVSDMVKAAGAKVPFNIDKETGVAWEPRAADWANTKKVMEGWIFVKSPKRGDVVAQRRDYETASGHVAIVTRDADQDGYYRTVSAGTDGVQEESSALSFPSFKSGVKVGPVVFRRYVGVK